ncbi:hypothetical protein [uncultured Microbulbifer sp.]|uniref:hypothetical protein n=1 Tax=uncultured Microbulbifer sp. TaxID=348147 RepID=UPI002602A5B2|nr:hypothetical protein [uncultured Microbulbifer sp.]
MVSRNLFSKRVFYKNLLGFSLLLQSTAALSDSDRTDFDIDNDGLIEINDLADLNEIRNNLNGASLYGVSTGCPSSGCRGFELSRNLDFDTNGDGAFDEDDTYWNGGAGWEPLGSSENPFTAILEGNNYSISNLIWKVDGVFEFPEANYIFLAGALRGATVQNVYLNITIFTGDSAVLIGSNLMLTDGQDDLVEACSMNDTSEGSAILTANVTLTASNCSDGYLIGASNLNTGVFELGELIFSPDVFVINDVNDVAIGRPNLGGDFSGSVNGGVIVIPHDGAIDGSGSVTFEGVGIDSSADGITITIPESGSATGIPASLEITPTYSTTLFQNGVPTAVVYSDGGEVSIGVEHFDQERDDGHSYSWSSNNLVPSNGLNENHFTFDPVGLSGSYEVNLTVTHSSGGWASSNIFIRVEESLPQLSDTQDTDGDGLSDFVEGVKDLDKDRIADYKDKRGAKNLLLSSATGAQMQSTQGTSLALGDSAYTAGKAMSEVTHEDIDSNFGENLSTQNSYKFLHGIFDFIVRDIEVAGVTDVVIPLTAAILPSARYLKYQQGVGWVDFVEDTENSIASAPGQLGECPTPGDSSYKPGLTEGHFCLQLTIKDGGPNDADRKENGIVVDPGAVAVAGSAMPVITVEADSLPVTKFKREDGEQVVLSFVIESDSADALVSALAIQAGGDLNEVGDIGKVRVYRDSNVSNGINTSYYVADGYYSEDDGSLVINFDTPYQLPIGETRFVVTYQF